MEKVVVHQSYFYEKFEFTLGSFINDLISKNHILLFIEIENDIALLELAEEVDLTLYTPACLPRSGEHFLGKIALATGMYLTKQTCLTATLVTILKIGLYLFRLGADRKRRHI